MKPPLSERLRPKSLEGVKGAERLTGERGFIYHLIETNRPLSLLLCGPPGCGKTTIARIYGNAFEKSDFFSLSGVSLKIDNVRKILSEPSFMNHRKILFVDEIHRLNKGQQDIFLPFIEDGSLILIGATTENPSFSINNALLSRMRVLSLDPLSPDAMQSILSDYEASSGKTLRSEIKKELISAASGDARHLLNLVENLEDTELEESHEIKSFIQQKQALYDKGSEEHYNLTSALHKAVRGSDPDGAIYWLSRMLQGGEDPLFITRRLIRIAAEDIGLADENAIRVALDAFAVFERLGSPEGEIALYEATIYLSLSPKSNRVYEAMKRAQKRANETRHLSPPKWILNAPTNLMKEMGYGKGYIYDHDTKEGCAKQSYFPEELKGECYYEPVERGFEREMKKRLAYYQTVRTKLS